MRRMTGILLGCALVAGSALVAPVADATFPGANGQIAFAGPDGNSQPRPQIFGLSADGTHRADLTQLDQMNATPDWSADGAKVAFSSASNGNNGPAPAQIWTMNADGSSQAKITTDSRDNNEPSWSPDGSKLAYAAEPTGPDFGNIFVVSSTGGTPTNVTNFSNGAIADRPDWSPDGSTIAYGGKNGPSYDIFKIAASGGTPDNVTNDASEDRDPSWSPDGSKIAYASNAGGSIFHIWVIAADGTSRTQVTTGTTNDFDPSWSPDGTKIAFDRGCPNDTCSNNQGNPAGGDIWTADAAGSNPVNLTNDAAPEYQPDWGTNTNAPTGPGGGGGGGGGGPATHTRSISLKLAKHLVASGSVATTGEEFKSCFDSVPVQIQKKRGTWRKVKSTTTNSRGAYHVGLADKPGKYRAVAPAVEVNNHADRCDKATSPTRSHS